MSSTSKYDQLPTYNSFVEITTALALPISVSELHGILCGYLCAGNYKKGDAYLQVIMAKGKINELTRAAASAIFALYNLSKQQITAMDFSFTLLLPDDDATLEERSQAFSEWCGGFTEALASSGVSYDDLEDEDAQDALSHLLEFAQLDVDELEMDEEDEKAFMEISEYARVAVLTLREEISSQDENPEKDIAH